MGCDCLNCDLYTAVYPGPILNGSFGKPRSYDFAGPQEEAKFCLSLMATDSETGWTSWRQVPIEDALFCIDSGDNEWRDADCDAYALSGMLGRTEWGREFEDNVESIEEGQLHRELVPSLDSHGRVCSWLLKKMSQHQLNAPYDNHVLGFRVYVHTSFRESASMLFGCGDTNRGTTPSFIAAEEQCLVAWFSIWP